MTEGPKQINMYGIRYFINGDLSDPYVKKLMVQSRNDLQQMKERNINDIDHVWLNKPKAYKIVSQFGIDSIYIDVPVFKGKEYKKEKERVTEVEKESYRFVPAIILCTAEKGNLYEYYAIPEWQEVGDISVCSGVDWKGMLDIIKESPTANLPGEVYKDGLIDPDFMEIRACYNWGRRNFSFHRESVPELDENILDLGDFIPGPVPYLGHDTTSGAEDYLKQALMDIDPTLREAGVAIICSDLQAIYDEIVGDANWSYGTLSFNDGYCAGWTDNGLCCNDRWGNSLIIYQIRCGYGHLYFQYKAEYHQQRTYSPGVVWVMGICMGYSDDCTQLAYRGSVAETTIGGPQTKTRFEYSYQKFIGVVNENDVERSDGGITFDFDFKYEDSDTRVCKMQEPCETIQNDKYLITEIYPTNYGYNGAFIQNTGGVLLPETEYICPNQNLHNLYFIMFLEDVYLYSGWGECSPWQAYGYGYDGAGTYLQGDIHDVSWADPEDKTGGYTKTYYYTLCINLNGERIEIDRTEEQDSRNEYEQRFYVTDSLILDFMGAPVYMYAYCKTRYDADQDGSGYRVLYIRYGYFLNGIHFQSQKFYPAGIENTEGRVSSLHDVFGSIERDGRYGFGQCAGFVVKEITKTKGNTIRELGV